MHPWDRLHRRAPGHDLAEPRGLENQLWSRDRELRQPRFVLGDLSRVGPDVKTRKVQNLARPAPNAPLLKRIARYPFALDPVGRTRGTFREAVPWGELHHEKRESVGAIVRDSHPKVEFTSPITALAAERKVTGGRR